MTPMLTLTLTKTKGMMTSYMGVRRRERDDKRPFLFVFVLRVYL